MAARQTDGVGARARSVLVVEDDIDIREALSSLLVEAGYDVSACNNGLEALTHLRAGRRADVIVLDLMMPVMDGWQFRVLQKRDPELASIPVLALSADGTPKAAAIDAAAYLRKPVSCDALLSAIERTLLALERTRVQATLVETERLAALGTLAAGVAHEINNPLAYVTSNVAYAARVLANDRASSSERDAARAALADAEDGCQRIRAIVQDMQLFSRPSDEARCEVDVRRVLDSAVNIAAHEIRPRARVVKEYGDVPAVTANEGRLAQLFSNLIVNAAQAIPEGDVANNEIRIVTRVEESWVVVEVRDTGAGIPEDVIGRIFDPFFTTKAIGVGTGLGLSIARKIALAAGGDIRVQSELGKSSLFRVRLPASRAPAERPRAPASEPIAEASKPRARILVVDDEAMIGAMLERVLAEAHDVESTTTPRDAIDRIRAGARFDLILCDMMMPDLNGIDVHAAIAELSSDQAARMLFLTGGATTPRVQEFLAERTGRVVTKPFVTSELVAQIDTALASCGGGACEPRIAHSSR